VIFVALDFDSESAAARLVSRLGADCRAYKVGLELLTSAGPGLARRLAADGCDVFMDLKLFEIPNSVAGAVRAAGRLGASMVSVHAMGGPRILEAAVAAASEFPRLRVVALTVVTSVTAEELAAVGVGGGGSVEAQVVRLARLAVESGCDGVVAAPGDVAVVRATIGAGPLVVAPGVRLPGDAGDEHVRADSPEAAFRAGATHVVLGRSITRATHPAAVLRALQQR
jgi:orotidine-5'-phosphate decarboxylase